MEISYQVSPALLLDIPDVYCQTALVGEPRIIKTQIGKRKRLGMVAV
jgi:hypothetical protein